RRVILVGASLCLLSVIALALTAERPRQLPLQSTIVSQDGANDTITHGSSANSRAMNSLVSLRESRRTIDRAELTFPKVSSEAATLWPALSLTKTVSGERNIFELGHEEDRESFEPGEEHEGP